MKINEFYTKENILKLYNKQIKFNDLEDYLKDTFPEYDECELELYLIDLVKCFIYDYDYSTEFKLKLLENYTKYNGVSINTKERYYNYYKNSILQLIEDEDWDSVATNAKTITDVLSYYSNDDILISYDHEYIEHFASSFYICGIWDYCDELMLLILED